MTTESFLKLRKLVTRHDEQVEEIVTRAAEEFRGGTREATFELRLTDPSGTKASTRLSVHLTPSGPTVAKHFDHAPDFTIITTPDIFRRIADGSYSPFSAYVDNHLKVHGDMAVGRAIVERLSGPTPDGTPAASSPIIYSPSYSPTGPGGGALTLSGCGFTAHGKVLLYYNYGSGEVEGRIVADANGQFKWTQGGIPCGPLTTDPNVGVIVTATDITTGKFVTQSYATPC